MAKTKKSHRKRKAKKKLKCPDGGRFGYDWDDRDGCEDCPLWHKCLDSKPVNYDRGWAYDDDDDDGREEVETSSKKKSKKQKKHKKKQDYRGAYIPFPALNKLLKVTNHFCAKLYLEYMRAGIIQKTNQPWCNNNYMAIILKWDKDTVRIAKNQLVKAGYITIIRERDKQGRLGKSYIKLKYFPSKRVIEKEEYLRQLDEDIEEFCEWLSVFHSREMKLKIRIIELERKVKKLRKKLRKKT